ncbi:hypothetical protein [Acidimangrovimonas pyrenivorans]|uniref:Uncharacterized protein n=1 Tax=Acidimangrovimonas pyrenivorans TaxID=2030798 RepID=A0ABV7AGA7_9RHOB
MAATKPSRTTIKNALVAANEAGFRKVSLQITLDGAVTFEFVGDVEVASTLLDTEVKDEQGLDWEDYA